MFLAIAGRGGHAGDHEKYFRIYRVVSDASRSRLATILRAATIHDPSPLFLLTHRHLRASTYMARVQCSTSSGALGGGGNIAGSVRLALAFASAPLAFAFAFAP